MISTGRKFTILLIALSAVLATGCLEKKTNKKNTSSNGYTDDGSGGWNNPWPTPTPTVIPTQTPPDPGQHYDAAGSDSVYIDCTNTRNGSNNTFCYEIPTVITKGTKNASTYNPAVTIAWSSDSWGEKYKFNTDAELNIRVVPRPAPDPADITTNTNEACHYDPAQYTLLSMTVKVTTTGGYSKSRTYEKIPVNKPSYPLAFPMSGANGNIKVEVTGLRWDCSYPDNCGGGTTRPMEAVWASQCVSFDMQFSTDYTRAWTRPVY